MGFTDPLSRIRTRIGRSYLSNITVFAMVTLFATTVPQLGHAANKDGNYAIRGMGSFICSEFLETLEADESTRNSYSEWISGYISAMNRTELETFDVSFVPSNTAITGLVGRICSTRPDVRVETALASLLNLMSTAKIDEESDLVRTSLGESSVMIRQSVLDQLLVILVDAEYLNVARGFDNTVRDALLDYQQDHDLPLTGLPDSNTLISAFAPQS